MLTEAQKLMYIHPGKVPTLLKIIQKLRRRIVKDLTRSYEISQDPSNGKGGTHEPM